MLETVVPFPRIGGVLALAALGVHKSMSEARLWLAIRTARRVFVGGAPCWCCGRVGSAPPKLKASYAPLSVDRLPL